MVYIPLAFIFYFLYYFFLAGDDVASTLPRPLTEYVSGSHLPLGGLVPAWALFCALASLTKRKFLEGKTWRKVIKIHVLVVEFGGPYVTKLLFIGNSLEMGGPLLSVGCVPLGVNRIT